MRMTASRRQTASNPSVKRMRDFSSGILKQLANVLRRLRNMGFSPGSSLRRFGGLAADDLHLAALGLDLRLGRCAERARAHRQFFGKFARAENLDANAPDAFTGAVGQTNCTQRHLINARTVIELVKLAD